jgi:hypothetical protein
MGGHTRRVSGNQRPTAATAVVLLILLAAAGATIPFIGQLVGPHIFIGVLLIPPALLKLGSTGPCSCSTDAAPLGWWRYTR